MWQRAVIHVDLDAFYASVEQLRDPSLRGRPVVVGGGRDEAGRPVVDRAVVSAASYEARAFGVRSAMPLARALRLCPDAVVVPVDFAAYRKASSAVFAIVRDYTPQVEPLSLDEAYLEVTNSQQRFGSPESIAEAIRDRVLQTCGLDASFGIATTKVVAKVASDLGKPRGFVVVPPGTEAATLAPLPLRTLPGLGPATEAALAGLGVVNLGQLAALPVEVVCRRVGRSHGQSLWERAQGMDSSPVVVPTVAKGISREETFSTDVADAAALHARLRDLSADVARRLRAETLRCRTITLKMRYADFATLTRQHSLAAATDADVAIASCVMDLFDANWSGAPLRLVGVAASGFDDVSQLDLFNVEGGGRRDADLDRTLDSLRNRFGDGVVRRGTDTALRDLDFRGDDLRSRNDGGND